MTYVTIIKFNENDKDDLSNIMSDIALKDESFKFEISDEILKVFSDSWDRAHKRGTWLTANIKPLMLSGYNVKKVD